MGRRHHHRSVCQKLHGGDASMGIKFWGPSRIPFDERSPKPSLHLKRRLDCFEEGLGEEDVIKILLD